MLVHICCSVDSHFFLQELRRIRPSERLVGFFYNPNIHPREEYELRLFDVRRSCERLGIALIAGDYALEVWLDSVRGLEEAAEKGARCGVCFDERLTKSALVAAQLGESRLTTTLLASPMKSQNELFLQGEAVAKNFGLEFVSLDVRSGGGTQRQSKMAKEANLYRQNYCGCVFALTKQRNAANKVALELFSEIGEGGDYGAGGENARGENSGGWGENGGEIRGSCGAGGNVGGGNGKNARAGESGDKNGGKTNGRAREGSARANLEVFMEASRLENAQIPYVLTKNTIHAYLLLGGEVSLAEADLSDVKTRLAPHQILPSYIFSHSIFAHAKDPKKPQKIASILWRRVNLGGKILLLGFSDAAQFITLEGVNLALDSHYEDIFALISNPPSLAAELDLRERLLGKNSIKPLIALENAESTAKKPLKIRIDSLFQAVDAFRVVRCES